MGGFKDKKILARVLEFIFSKNVRSQDAVFYFYRVARNSNGRDLAWKFLKDNWKMINERYNVGGHLMEHFVASFSHFTSGTRAKQLKEFFKKHPVPGVERTIQQVLERIYSNAAWVKRDRKNIELWLKSK